MRAIFFILSVALAAGADYAIAPAAGTKFELQVLKTGFMSGKVHIFTFEKYAGQLSYDEAAPERASVNFTIDTGSIVCRDTWVDEKDKKKVIAVALEMMDSAKHPEMTFHSQSIARRADGGFDVTGPLTIKGVAKPITLKVTVVAEGRALRFKGDGVILRKNYGISPPSPVPFGLIGNKEEMPVHFELIASPR
ncbi:MAG: YceI family protein [Acidobacteriota bacterium]